MLIHKVLLGALLIATTTAQKIVFEGRLNGTTSSASIDSGATPYNPNYVLGQGLKWADILKLGTVKTPALFDRPNDQSLGITINDKSIFARGTPPNPQTGFRRAELVPNGIKTIFTGVMTYHFSVMADATRPLNYTHSYQLLFLETTDGTHVFGFQIGGIDGKSLTLMSSSVEAYDKLKPLYNAPLTTTWQNWAITVDWTKATLTAYFSAGAAPLTKVVDTRPNAVTPNATVIDNLHIGFIKAGMGATNPHNGTQPTGINEGLVFSSVFVEDSAGGAVTLSPGKTAVGAGGAAAGAQATGAKIQGAKTTKLPKDAAKITPNAKQANAKAAVPKASPK
ncbi:hypothetical protein SmJEL517_g01466 [Synchytrium microbalum]|uniref:Glycoside hydrolase 131 catalytic N-terminal domain-containing protein n=1 Tax=Synchytrium microbalum TaxID=1806994 RepID=A0A507C3Y7_9FUNG|nr:uncharacterized protein SmJEL517_g01466 [Synchytrium microbalum]TPX36250.1 hypothetical protein SmJEL517_g01466 [Synchytrium microbalum]